MIALLPARPLGSLPVFYDQEEVYMIEKKLPEDLYPFFWYFPIPVFGADWIGWTVRGEGRFQKPIIIIAPARTPNPLRWFVSGTLVHF